MIIKFIRKYLMNGYVSIPLMLCIILSTWNSIASNKLTTYHLSGEEMFRGIFFVEGKYAELIPELKAVKTTYLSENLSIAEGDALAAAKNQLMELIKAENPHYFDDFKTTLQIASPSVVKEKIVEAQTLLEKKASELSKMSDSDIKKNVQKAESLLANQQGKGFDKKAVKKLLEEFGKNNTKANSGTGTCAILVIYLWVFLWNEIAFGITSTKGYNNLLLEQIAGSVCNVAPQVV